MGGKRKIISLCYVGNEIVKGGLRCFVKSSDFLFFSPSAVCVYDDGPMKEMLNGMKFLPYLRRRRRKEKMGLYEMIILKVFFWVLEKVKKSVERMVL